MSTRTRRFRVRLEPVRFEGEDLRDYAHHLSHHLGRGQPWEHRIYDFFGEQRGEVDAVDLQISLERSALSTRYTLEMDRGLREGLWGLRTNRLPPELY